MDAAALTRSWPALAAVGAGLIQLALSAVGITATGGGPALRATAVVLIVLGSATLVWGAATLARARVVLPRASMAGSLAGILACVMALVIDPDRITAMAVAAASGLLLLVGVFCAVALRLRRREAAPDATARTGVLGIFVAAAAVAALVTPALAATEASRFGSDQADRATSIHTH